MTKSLFDFLSENFENIYKKLIPLSVKDIKHLGSLCAVLVAKTLFSQVQNESDSDATTLFYFKFRLGHLLDPAKIKNNVIIYELVRNYVHTDSRSWISGYKTMIDSIIRFIDSYLFISGNSNEMPDDVIAINKEIAKLGNIKI